MAPPPAGSSSPSDRRKRRHATSCTSRERMAGSRSPTPATQASYFFPDNLAPEGKTTYVFGFRDVTGYSDQQVHDQKGKTQICAPLLWFDEYQSALANDVQITVTNLGMQVRPDLTDGHTLHWHGFRNANPFYDGVPEMSVSIPIGRDLTYFYQPKDPGTYMYHCHFEDVEHVQMGMTGPLFVRPRQNGTVLGGYNKFAYNDGDGTTGYDREYALLLTEMYLESHWQDAHIQQPLWDQYRADAWFINGRSYPDTLEPSTGFYGPTGPRPAGIAVGDPNPWPNPRVAAPPRLSHQPLSSLVSCNAGDRVLLRLANLGYQEHAMTAPGLVLDVDRQGRDAARERRRQDVDADRDHLDRARRELRLPLHGSRRHHDDHVRALQPRLRDVAESRPAGHRRHAHGNPRPPGRLAARPDRAQRVRTRPCALSHIPSLPRGSSSSSPVS